MNEPSAALTAHVAEAERLLVRARDELIAARRAAGAPNPPGLTDINAVLSLVVGVEYPLGGLHRTVLGTSADALDRLLERARAA